MADKANELCAIKMQLTRKQMDLLGMIFQVGIVQIPLAAAQLITKRTEETITTFGVINADGLGEAFALVQATQFEIETLMAVANDACENAVPLSDLN